MTTRDVLMSIVALAGLAAPAHATITYSSCNSGCSNSNAGVTFTTFGTTAGGLGDTMSSAITFVSGGLGGTPAIYVDGGTLTEFDAFNGTTPNDLTVTGTALAQTASGNGTSIQVKLPANTYAFAVFLSTVSGNGGPWAELVNSASNFNGTNANYSLSTSAGTGTFFGIISDTPISSIFFGNLSNFDGKVEIQSFEVGGPAAPRPPPKSPHPF